MPSVFLATTSTPGGTLQEFTGFADTILDWLITTFGTLLTWMIGHPIVFIGLIVSLIVMAIGTLRHLIGGSKKNESASIPPEAV